MSPFDLIVASASNCFFIATRMNLFCQHARFMFGCVAMEIIQPLLLHAVEDRLGQKPRDVLEYLLRGYTRQVSKDHESETLQLSFDTFFQLLAQAQEELGGQSWFDMFATTPNNDDSDEKNRTGAALSKKEEAQGTWFDFCCTQGAADAWKDVMDVADTGDKAKPADDDPRLYFLMDLFSGFSL